MTVSIVERSCSHYRDHDKERLTLRSKAEMLETTARALHQHGVTGAEHERLLAARARWFGRPMDVAPPERTRASDPPAPPSP